MNASGMSAFTMPADREHAALIAEWLGWVFLAPPGQGRIEQLRTEQGATFLRDLARQLECADAIEVMLDRLARGAAKEVTDHLSHNFCILFEGIRRDSDTQPYESLYHGDIGRLFQDPVSDMNALLRQLDISVDAECAEPPDHLSVELSALAVALRRNDLAISAELAKRLQAWTALFVEHLQGADQHGFYAAAATVLRAFLTSINHNARHLDVTSAVGRPGTRKEYAKCRL